MRTPMGLAAWELMRIMSLNDVQVAATVGFEQFSNILIGDNG